MKPDSLDFGYDLGRQPYRVTPQFNGYNPQVYSQQSSSPPDGYSYRNNSVSYQYSPSAYYKMPFDEITDDTQLEYGFQSPGYSMLGPENMGIPQNCVPGGSVRAWSHSGLPSRNPSIFMQQDPYAHHGLPIQKSPISTRPAMSLVEPRRPSLGTDRVLPFPAAGRTTSSYMRSSETSLPSSQSSLSYSTNVMIPPVLQSRPARNDSISESGPELPTYVTLSSPTSDSLSPYSSQHAGVSHQPAEIYPASNDGLYHHDSGSSVDMSYTSYGPSSSSSKCGSASSHATSDGSSLPAISAGLLVNEHPYVRGNAVNATYPTPPMDTRSAVSQLARRSVAGLQSEGTGLERMGSRHEVSIH